MRIALAITLIVFCISCNSKKQEKRTQPGTKTELPDSAGLVMPNRAVNSYAPVDRSPMDMSYFPVDYPLLRMAGTAKGLPNARVIYSRPHLQGRNLFTSVLKYGEPWRLGANEATELQLFSTTTIQGRKVNAGRYTIYCLPEPDSWTIILNSNIDTWGLHPDSTKDIARFTIPVIPSKNFFEFFTMVFEKTASGADLVMAWERTEARLPFAF